MNEETKSVWTRRASVSEGLGWILTLLSLAAAIYGMVTIKGAFVTHYDIHGAPDRYGSAGVLLMMPILMLICNAVLSLVGHLLPAECWNMPCKVKKTCAARVYGKMTEMLGFLCLTDGLMALVFTVQTMKQDGGSMLIFLAVFLGLLTAAVAVPLVQAVRINRGCDET